METGKWNFVISGRGSVLLALALLVSLSAVPWFSAPSYVDLYVPIRSYHSDIWNHSQHTTLSYTGESGVSMCCGATGRHTPKWSDGRTRARACTISIAGSRSGAGSGQTCTLRVIRL